MSQPVALQKLAAQVCSLSFELSAPALHNCSLDFFRKLGECLGHADSLHNIVSPGSNSRFLRGQFACLKFGLRTLKLKAGFLKHKKVRKIN